MNPETSTATADARKATEDLKRAITEKVSIPTRFFKRVTEDNIREILMQISAANLSDATHHSVDYPHVPTAVPAWRPADTRFDDKYRVSAPVGSFRANPWGLHDMHGNVAEWTLSPHSPGRAVVRGGSWYDRPKRCRSSFRLSYPPDQSVYDVGFRVVSIGAKEFAESP